MYVNFATELEVQSKQLLEKVERAGSSLNDRHGDEVQSKYLRVGAAGFHTSSISDMDLASLLSTQSGD